MKLLLVSATKMEIMPTLQYLQDNWSNPGPLTYTKGQKDIHICTTGVGMVATTYALTKALQNDSYDLALQAGVGGSYDQDIALGSLVFITTEQFADLGAEDRDDYIDIFEMGLLERDNHPFSNGNLQTPLHPVHDKIQLPQVSGITVNTVTGHERTLKLRSDKYKAQIESMEGAALHYVCLHEHVPFAQVRSISNYVEPRDRSKWKMKEAIIALNKWLIDFSESE